MRLNTLHSALPAAEVLSTPSKACASPRAAATCLSSRERLLPTLRCKRMRPYQSSLRPQKPSEPRKLRCGYPGTTRQRKWLKSPSKPLQAPALSYTGCRSRQKQKGHHTYTLCGNNPTAPEPTPTRQRPRPQQGPTKAPKRLHKPANRQASYQEPTL